MKNKKTKWYCLECGYSEINHKQMDGLSCPKCKKRLLVWKAGEIDG